MAAGYASARLYQAFGVHIPSLLSFPRLILPIRVKIQLKIPWWLLYCSLELFLQLLLSWIFLWLFGALLELSLSLPPWLFLPFGSAFQSHCVTLVQDLHEAKMYVSPLLLSDVASQCTSLVLSNWSLVIFQNNHGTSTLSYVSWWLGYCHLEQSLLNYSLFWHLSGWINFTSYLDSYFSFS